MILRELDRFLGASSAFDENPDDLAQAIRAARRVLKFAQDNALLHAVVSATHGADTELLPLLTTHAESLLAGPRWWSASGSRRRRPRRRPARRRDRHGRPAGAQPRHAALGHPRRTADDIAWIAERVLREPRVTGDRPPRLDSGSMIVRLPPTWARTGPARQPRGTPARRSRAPASRGRGPTAARARPGRSARRRRVVGDAQREHHVAEVGLLFARCWHQPARRRCGAAYQPVLPGGRCSPRPRADSW